MLSRGLINTSIMELERDGPVWQDDSEVTSCFLCHSKYSFFNRRHHCRKCGNVVCGNCSDQLVKYFPNTYVVNSDNTLSRLNQYEIYRTCDVCVEEITMIRTALFGNANPSPSPLHSQVSSIDEGISFSQPSDDQVDDNECDNDNDSTTKYLTRTTTCTMETSTDSSLVLPQQDETSSSHGHNHKHSDRHGRHHHRHNKNQAEDDISSDDNLCPICSTNLLKEYIGEYKKKGLSVNNISHDNYEAFKESHINDCLTSFDFNPDAQRFSSPQSTGVRGHTRNKMLVYNIPPIPKPKFESIPNNTGNSVDTFKQSLHDDNILTSSNSNEEVVGSVNSYSTIQPSAEKQTFQGIDNECVICLEDLKPGDKVGRLECLCIFHYKCIKDWFNKKGYGECPVHFVHH